MARASAVAMTGSAAKAGSAMGSGAGERGRDDGQRGDSARPSDKREARARCPADARRDQDRRCCRTGMRDVEEAGTISLVPSRCRTRNETRLFSVPLRLRSRGRADRSRAVQEVPRRSRSALSGDRRSPAWRRLVPRRHRQQRQARRSASSSPTAASGSSATARCTRTASTRSEISATRSIIASQEDLRDAWRCSVGVHGYSARGSRHVLPRPRSQVPADDLLGGRRAGARHAHAGERVRERPRAPRVPVLRSARLRQDHARAHRRQGAQLRAGPPTARAVRHVQACTSIGNGSAVDYQEMDGALEPRHRRDPRAHRGGALPARGPAQEGLRHRRSPHAHDRGVQRPAEDARGAAAARHVRARDDRAAQAARTRSCRAASATTSSSCRRRGSRSTSTSIFEQEKLKIEAGAISLLVRESGGSVRDALSLCDQIISYVGDATITEAHVAEVLGVADRSLTRTLVRALADGRCRRGARAVESAIERGVDEVQLARAIVRYLRDLAVLQVAPDRARAGRRRPTRSARSSPPRPAQLDRSRVTPDVRAHAALLRRARQDAPAAARARLRADRCRDARAAGPARRSDRSARRARGTARRQAAARAAGGGGGGSAQRAPKVAPPAPPSTWPGADRRRAAEPVRPARRGDARARTGARRLGRPAPGRDARVAKTRLPSDRQRAGFDAAIGSGARRGDRRLGQSAARRGRPVIALPRDAHEALRAWTT